MSPLLKANEPQNTLKARKRMLKNGILNYFSGFLCIFLS